MQDEGRTVASPDLSGVAFAGEVQRGLRQGQITREAERDCGIGLPRHRIGRVVSPGVKALWTKVVELAADLRAKPRPGETPFGWFEDFAPSDVPSAFAT
jgi:hypothetical protein